jgi:hypothetical protein
MKEPLGSSKVHVNSRFVVLEVERPDCSNSLIEWVLLAGHIAAHI